MIHYYIDICISDSTRTVSDLCNNSDFKHILQSNHDCQNGLTDVSHYTYKIDLHDSYEENNVVQISHFPRNTLFAYYEKHKDRQFAKNLFHSYASVGITTRRS